MVSSKNWEERIFLRPKSSPLLIDGAMAYKEAYGAWSIITLKKRILEEFPDLRKRGEELEGKDFYYRMIFYKSYEELENAIKTMKEKRLPLPILLHFYVC